MGKHELTLVLDADYSLDNGLSTDDADEGVEYKSRVME